MYFNGINAWASQRVNNAREARRDAHCYRRKSQPPAPSRFHWRPAHVHFAREHARVCPKDRHLLFSRLGSVHISLPEAYPRRRRPFPRKSLDGQRKSSYSARKENIVWCWERRTSRPGSSREYTDTCDWPVCARSRTASRMHTRTHAHHDDGVILARGGRPPSRILRAFIDHYIAAPGSTSAYLVSRLAGSKIFPIPFHQGGKRVTSGRPPGSEI